jgi:16S rRNA (cytidine1402-2'-O)-methyltransferase
MNDSPHKGALHIVATPIGNLEDITLRALRILKEADVILAEDTRHTRGLCTHYDIHTRLESYHIFNEHGKCASLVKRILNGEDIALVTDAGMPCVSDPGFLLIREAVEAGIEPDILPGASAVLFAVAASALPSDRFAFHGFLPVKSGRRSARLKEIAESGMTAVIFESPFRLSKLLCEIPEYFGVSAQVAVIREATKLHQEILRGNAAELAELYGKKKWKGECVVVVRSGDCADEEDTEQ